MIIVTHITFSRESSNSAINLGNFTTPSETLIIFLPNFGAIWSYKFVINQFVIPSPAKKQVQAHA